VAALAAIVGLYLVASGKDEGTTSALTRPPVARGAPGGQGQTPTTTTKPQAAPRKPRARRTAPPTPKVERIVVRNGKPAGGAKRLEYRRGERVRFSVQSNTADEVHVHGFDVAKNVPANRRVRFGFDADIEGVFEVELHGTHTKIAELRIRP
jgi:hypothetical protein